MFNIFIKSRYAIHSFLQRYNEALIDDALCEKLKYQLKMKANYHRMKAASLVNSEVTRAV